MDTFKNIKVIFFDVGDTLYRNEALEKEYPRELYKLLSETKGISEDQAKQLFIDTTEKLKQTEKAVTKVRTMAELGYTRARAHEAFCKVDPTKFLSKDDKLDAVITNLAHRYKLGIISNFKRSHLLQILTALGLKEEQFPFMVTEDIVQEIKPALEPFQKAIEISGAGVSAAEVLYVGDSPGKDMSPAKKVGMKTALVKLNPDDKDLEHADACVSTIKDLASYLL